tara:strand:+ start:1395 stop:2489 length:1095 start_codon:yes stop_codon:yes gene_type:complete
MVFKNILENITDFFSDKNTKQKNRKVKRPLNQLKQGLVYLQNKQQKFNELNNSSILMEQFNNDKLDDVSQNELTILENLKSEYNQKLTQYSQSYKTFMEEYYKATQEIVSCKADCKSRHRPGTSNWQKSKIACEAGCDLKSPYVAKCKDSYLGYQGSKCSDIAKDKCSNGNVILGMDPTVTSSDYADDNGVTIKDGCCECGGGIGGPPTSEINAFKVKDCNEIEKALGYNKGQAQWAVNRCHQAQVASFQKNKNMWQEYEKLSKENEDLIKLAQNIFDKIKELKTIDENINQSIKDEETHLKNQLSLYENVYANIQNYDKSKQTTVEGQVEDMLLKERSQSLQLYLWLSLAIITFSLVIHRMRK